MDTGAIEGRSRGEVDKMKGSKSFEQLIMEGLRPSMSMTDLLNHIGNCISEQMSSENQTVEKEAEESQKMLEDIAQHLLSDFQFTPCSDEESLMTRANSLCCLLQKDGSPIQSSEVSEGGKNAKTDSSNPDLADDIADKDDTIASEGGGCKQAPGMPRINSYGDLLLHLHGLLHFQSSCSTFLKIGITKPAKHVIVDSYCCLLARMVAGPSGV